MYKCVEKLLYWTYPLLIIATLSGCGGAATDTTTNEPSTLNNKLNAAINASVANSLAPAPSSSAPVSSSTPSSATSLPKSSVGSLSGASRSSSSSIQTTITISWIHPDKRENGQFLELDEIGGYELRFKEITSATYTHLKLYGNATNSYTTNLFPTNGDIQIAVFDTNGLYSDFIPIHPEK